jgi:hypothetical protein
LPYFEVFNIANRFYASLLLGDGCVLEGKVGGKKVVVEVVHPDLVTVNNVEGEFEEGAVVFDRECMRLVRRAVSWVRQSEDGYLVFEEDHPRIARAKAMEETNPWGVAECTPREEARYLYNLAVRQVGDGTTKRSK